MEEHGHSVGHCSRCNTTVEPMVSKQWFVSMEPLAKPALEVVRDKSIEFVPERFTKTYTNWLESIRDWCISRQLWWGHRIPAWYCQDWGETIVMSTLPRQSRTRSRRTRYMVQLRFMAICHNGLA